MFVPPGSGAAWGSGSPGGNGEDSATCRSTQSADSMGTPQSHFKARPRRASSKRTLGESTPPRPPKIQSKCFAGSQLSIVRLASAAMLYLQSPSVDRMDLPVWNHELSDRRPRVCVPRSSLPHACQHI